jgi:hypothetical protein
VAFISNLYVKLENGEDIKTHLIEQTKQTTVPNVFVNGKHVGGYDSTSKAQQDGSLAKLLNRKRFFYLQKINIFNLKQDIYGFLVKNLDIDSNLNNMKKLIKAS